MDTLRLAEQIVEFVNMASGALTDEKLTDEVVRIILEHVSKY